MVNFEIINDSGQHFSQFVHCWIMTGFRVDFRNAKTQGSINPDYCYATDVRNK
ncbi:unnamed protein product [Rodentolepis nana]|uniref:Uncharacterized protein n=1 Tax=Rodentolepis nana TaxID=102285 RepID=A0A3P7RYR2_RODNA|nr:unnamed protein product [Rodentolepis nana]